MQAHHAHYIRVGAAIFIIPSMLVIALVGIVYKQPVFWLEIAFLLLFSVSQAGPKAINAIAHAVAAAVEKFRGKAG